MKTALLCLTLTLSLVVGCSSDDPPRASVDSGSTTGTDDSTTPDLPLDGQSGDAETPPDTGPPAFDKPAVFEAAPFQVGVSRRKLPAPVGMGMAGSAGGLDIGGGGGPKSRFTDAYTATKGVWTHPTIHCVAIVGQPDTVVFMRVDAIGMKQEIRQAVIQRVIDKGGPDLAQGLVIAATHTHTGPGRLFDNPIWAAILDSFFPEFYMRTIEDMADGVLEAIADAEPAKFAHTMVETSELHDDRRCESPVQKDGRMPVLVFTRQDDTPKAIIMAYSVHGTVMDPEARMFTRDIHGGIELKLEEQFTHPVTALFFNSWSGDMSPERPDAGESFGLPPKYGNIEQAGNIAQNIVLPAIADLDLVGEMPVRTAIGRVPLNREVLGYAKDEFLYDYGAVYCGAGIDAPCFEDAEQGAELPKHYQLLAGCIPFGEGFPAPLDTVVGAIQFGDLYLATMPGEPVTSLGTEVMEAIRTASGTDHVWLLGYAQDYIGYSLPEDDWYLGGYETSGSLWGPRQGPYVKEKTLDFAYSFITGAELPWESLAAPDPIFYEVEEFAVEPAGAAPSVISEPQATYAPGDLVEFSISGGDPWLLAPLATLEVQTESGEFEPLLRRNTTPISSDGYEFELEVSVTPSYDDVDGPVERVFEWSVRFATLRAAASTNPALVGGTYRIRVSGLQHWDAPYSVTTAPFQVN